MWGIAGAAAACSFPSAVGLSLLESPRQDSGAMPHAASATAVDHEPTRQRIDVLAKMPSAQLALVRASSGTQISGPTLDREGGLFSTLFVHALGTGAADVDGDTQSTLSELETWPEPRVQRGARSDQCEQSPSLVLGNGVGRGSDSVAAYGVSR